MRTEDIHFLEKAIELSKKGMLNGDGGPFGCVIVKDGEIIGRGWNQVVVHHDPTAHAEMVAIREACRHLQSSQLTGCDVYTSCEPCPMCLGAIYWARPDRVIYANTKEQAAAINFDDSFIYQEFRLPDTEKKVPLIHMPDDKAWEVFKLWEAKEDKRTY